MIAIATGLTGRAETSKRNFVCWGWGWPFDRFERSTAISSKEDSIAEQGCGNKEGNVTGRRRWKQRRKTGRERFGAGVGGTLDAYIDYRVGVSGRRSGEKRRT